MRHLCSHHANRAIRAAAAALAGILLATSSATATIIYNLGTLGGTRSFGTAVNDSGQVAGWSNFAGDTAAHAFRYDGIPGSGGVMHDLGSFGEDSLSMGINNMGQVAGYSAFTGGAVVYGFRYDGTPGNDGVMQPLYPQYPLGWTSSYGFAINDAAQVVGISQVYGNTGYHAMRYDGIPDSGGVIRDLGTLGGTNSSGRAVNNVGQVAGFSQTTGNTAEHAFRYDGAPGAGGVMRDLGTLGGTTSYGVGINEAGQVTRNSFIAGSTVRHAFRYDGTPGAGGIMRDLGTLGGTNSLGVAVNDAGQVVGTSDVAGDAEMHAFLYIGTPGAGEQMIDLHVWLNANNPTEGAKWTLSEASDLSNTGWIAGTGLYDPDGPGGIAAADRAYLLDATSLVPEPSTLALLMVAVPALLRRRERI